MHEIFGLKHVLSTFQETVWSHLNSHHDLDMQRHLDIYDTEQTIGQTIYYRKMKTIFLTSAVPLDFVHIFND